MDYNLITKSKHGLYVESIEELKDRGLKCNKIFYENDPDRLPIFIEGKGKDYGVAFDRFMDNYETLRKKIEELLKRKGIFSVAVCDLKSQRTKSRFRVHGKLVAIIES